ncbi:MAG: peroxiredoxin [Magnetovibrio sp.]|nr:peroxiredoxin [Magnetovibrio sp.]
MRLIPTTTFRIQAPAGEAAGAGPFGLTTVTTDELFAAKRVVAFAVPGAFSPTCSARHLPGYEELHDDFRTVGVDAVYCLAVNDPFVMAAWGRALNIEKVGLLPDGNGEFTRKMGMLVEKGNLSCGLRSWRYAMFVEDRVITRIFVEDGFADNAPDDPFEVTGADAMLNYLHNWREPLP